MPRPIFIIGSPRSGTSVLTWAIGQHPNISLQPESNWIPVLIGGALEAYKVGTARGQFSQLSNAKMPLEAFIAHFGRAVDAISRDAFERRVELFIPGFRNHDTAPEKWAEEKAAKLIHAPQEPKERWIDGTPEYTFSAYELSLLFPDSQFIHILRRPDQVVNSLAHFKNAGGRNFRLRRALKVWTAHTLAAKQAASMLGKRRLLRIDNADLAQDGATVLRRCFEFLGEEYCERATWALKSNLNSSKAVDRQDHTNSKLAGSRKFESAMTLYRNMRDEEVPDEPDAALLASERKRFG